MSLAQSSILTLMYELSLSLSLSFSPERNEIDEIDEGAEADWKKIPSRYGATDCSIMELVASLVNFDE